jgi:membrane protein implicated in regulation of membrane protease activity
VSFGVTGFTDIITTELIPMMIWWYWILLGLALLAVELATPGGFFFIFFAVSALVIGLLEVIGIVSVDWLQWVLFSVLSIVCLAVFRKPLLERMRASERNEPVDSLVGEVAVVSTPIPAGQYGRAELRGSLWNARNVDDGTLSTGDRCRVVAVRGLEIDIRPERSH